MASFAANKYIISLSPLIGAVKVRSSAICLFISHKALSASSFQAKSLFLMHRFKVLKNGSDFSTAFDRNLLRLASFPFRICTSFSVMGDGMSIMVSSDMSVERFVNQLLVSSTKILEPEGHLGVAKYTLAGMESGFFFILLGHLNLVITLVSEVYAHPPASVIFF
ncbi:hypothetical protein Tco_1207753 [Tanacetum coccineum]